MKRDIPILVTLLTGFFFIITFFIPHKPFGDMEQQALIWYGIVAGFSMILGIDSLLTINIRKIARRKEGWGYSLLLVLAFIVTIVSAAFDYFFGSGSPFDIQSSFMFVYTYFIIPLQGTMFALLAFFIASAAYRAFRARSTVSTLLLVAATIVMLGRVPGGEVLQKWFPFTGNFFTSLFVWITQGSDWIMNVPQLAAKRGILIGAYLGAAATSLRILLGIDRPYLS